MASVLDRKLRHFFGYLRVFHFHQLNRPRYRMKWSSELVGYVCEIFRSHPFIFELSFNLSAQSLVPLFRRDIPYYAQECQTVGIWEFDRFYFYRYSIPGFGEYFISNDRKNIFSSCNSAQPFMQKLLSCLVKKIHGRPSHDGRRIAQSKKLGGGKIRQHVVFIVVYENRIRKILYELAVPLRALFLFLLEHQPVCYVPCYAYKGIFARKRKTYCLCFNKNLTLVLPYYPLLYHWDICIGLFQLMKPFFHVFEMVRVDVCIYALAFHISRRHFSKEFRPRFVGVQIFFPVVYENRIRKKIEEPLQLPVVFHQSLFGLPFIRDVPYYAYISVFGFQLIRNRPYFKCSLNSFFCPYGPFDKRHTASGENSVPSCYGVCRGFLCQKTQKVLALQFFL